MAVPKYIRLRDELLTRIRSGEYTPGDRLPTREALIREYKVTRTTVNRSIEELVRSGLLTCSRRTGTFVTDTLPAVRAVVVSGNPGTSPDPHARNIDLTALYNSLIAGTDGLRITFVSPGDVSRNLQPLNGYDAVLWIQPDDTDMDRFKALGSKVIITNRYPDSVNFISTNHREAIREATEHYIRVSGPDSQIYFAGFHSSGFVAEERKQGFVDACEIHNRFYRLIQLKRDFESDLATLMKLPLHSDTPTVMISSSSILTGIVLTMMRKKKLEYGKTFYYCDFDNPDAGQIHGIPVSTILQDYQAMGTESLAALKTVHTRPVRKFIPYRIRDLIE